MVAIGQLIEPGLQLQSVLSSCGLRQQKEETSCIDSLKLDYNTLCSDHVPRRWPFVVAGSSSGSSTHSFHGKKRRRREHEV